MKKTVFLVLALLGILLAVKFLLPFLFPFLLGAGLALAAEPGVRFLTARVHLPRAAASGLGVGAVFAAICALVTVLVGLLLREVRVLAGILPQMEQTAQGGLETLRLWLLNLSERASPGIRSLLQRNVNELFSDGTAMLDEMTRRALGAAGSFLTQLPDGALGIGTAVLAAFLTSAELPEIRQWLRGQLPKQPLQSVAGFLSCLRATAGQWVIAQLKLVSITCLLLTVGFLLLKIEYAPLWAMVVGLVDALPILGTGTVLVPWSIVCLLQHDTARALGLLGMYAATALTRSTLEPRLLGRQLGLDPLVTLVCMYVGFRLWGIAGMVLTPLLVIAVKTGFPAFKTAEN